MTKNGSISLFAPQKEKKQKSYFKSRLDKAVAFILSEKHLDRQLDEAFEMYDGDQMATAIVRRARKNPRLDTIIRTKYSTAQCDWYKIAALRDNLTAQELEQEADQTRRIEQRINSLCWESLDTKSMPEGKWLQ